MDKNENCPLFNSIHKALTSTHRRISAGTITKSWIKKGKHFFYMHAAYITWEKLK